MTKIYALIDPRDGQVRYVGKANDPVSRLKSHHNEKGTTRKCRWFAALKSLGLSPTIEILEDVDGCWKSAEIRWIAYYRSLGTDLCNHTDGGEGLTNALPETREKLSAIRREMWEKNRDKLLAALASPTRRAKISAANKGKSKSPEHIAKLPQNQKGRKTSMEWRENISRALRGNSYAKGTKRTPEQIAAQRVISTGRKYPGRKQTPEANAKRSATQSGRPKSEEFKRKASEAAYRRWAREKERKNDEICRTNG